MPQYYEAVGVSGSEFSNYGAFMDLEQAEQMARSANAPVILEDVQEDGYSLYWVLADESELFEREEFVEVEENPAWGAASTIGETKDKKEAEFELRQRRKYGIQGHIEVIAPRAPFLHEGPTYVLRHAPGQSSKLSAYWNEQNDLGWPAYKGKNPFPWKKCIRKAKAKGVTDPNAYCAVVDRKMHQNPSMAEERKALERGFEKGKQLFRKKEILGSPLVVMSYKQGRVAYPNDPDLRDTYAKGVQQGAQYLGEKKYKTANEMNQVIASGKFDRMYRSLMMDWERNPTLRERASHIYGDVKHALTKRSQSKKAITRLLDMDKPAPASSVVAPQRFGLGKKRNPEEAAQSLYDEFHGAPSSSTVEVHYDEHEHSTLASLGYLCSLVVKTPNGKRIINVAETKSPRDIPNPLMLPMDKRVLLCSNEEATSLYFVGGDQEVSLSALALDKEEYIKDLMVLGELQQVTYMTQKAFDSMEDIAYYHALGEETGEKPILLYDPISCLLSVAGGAYKVESVGLTN